MNKGKNISISSESYETLGKMNDSFKVHRSVIVDLLLKRFDSFVDGDITNFIKLIDNKEQITI